MYHIFSPDSLIHEVLFRCPNAGIRAKASRSIPYVKEWASIYLRDAHARLAPQLHGYDLTIEDIYTLQQLCPYEVSFTCRPTCQANIYPIHRPSPLAIPNFVNFLRRMNGKALTMRKPLSLFRGTY